MGIRFILGFMIGFLIGAVAAMALMEPSREASEGSHQTSQG
jgi:hypothetical protein